MSGTVVVGGSVPHTRQRLDIEPLPPQGDVSAYCLGGYVVHVLPAPLNLVAVMWFVAQADDPLSVPPDRKEHPSLAPRGRL